MAIVPTLTGLPTTEFNAVTLPRYAQIVRIDECLVYGVTNAPNQDTGNNCRGPWLEHTREWLIRYLAMAQEMIEEQVDYPLSKRWFTEEIQPFNRKRNNPMQLREGYVIEAGIKATSDISLGEAIDQTSDPAVIGPVATTVTDINEIFIYHPGTGQEMIPSSVTISGGNVTIEIPRCRTVTIANEDNPATGLNYNDLTNFETTVDIKRVYNDPSINAEIVFPHQCTDNCGLNGCSETTQTGCIYIRNPRLGIIDVQPATYLNGSWSGNIANWCGCPEFVRVNYRAGRDITFQIEEAIIRLAHTLMPAEFCSSCNTWQQFHKRDNEIPGVLTRERLNCPFGVKNGAWFAWTLTQNFRLMKGFVL